MAYAKLIGGPRDSDTVRLDAEIGYRPEHGYVDLEYMSVRSHGFVDPARLADRSAKGLTERIVRYQITDELDDDGVVLCRYLGECVPAPDRSRGQTAFIGDYVEWIAAARRRREAEQAERDARRAAQRAQLKAHLDQLPFSWSVAHAFHPRIGESHRRGRRTGRGYYDPSNDHLIVTEPVKLGRLVRGPGDALCKPAARFWGLERGAESELPDCKTCLDRADRIIGTARPG